MNDFTNWSELPFGLNATQIAKILGLSKPLVYELFNKQGFPSIKVNKRWLVPQDQFREWLKNETAKKGSISNV